MLSEIWTKIKKDYLSSSLITAFTIVGLGLFIFLIYLIYSQLQLNNPNPVSVIGLILSSLGVFLLLGLLLASNVVSSAFTFIKEGKKRVSKLRRRIIIAFSLGAALPTIIVAVFSTYFFNFGIQSWFDRKITTVLEQSVIVGESYIAEHILQLKETAISVADDLSDMYYDLIHNSELFTKVLNAQAEMRSLDEAIVFQKTTNTILAQTSLSFSLSFATIPSHMTARADKGEIVRIASDPTKIRILIKLRDYNDTYLLIGRLVDSKIIDHIDKTNGAASEYNRLKGQITSMQIKFSMVFILLALILVASAIIWGRNFAEKIVRPIRELVIAAEKVKSGDLTVQVPEEGLKKDEIKVLSIAFNRMVMQIDRGQKDLLVAQRALAWSDVARRVAHEIKNPLTPIQLSAERLIKKFKEEVSDKESFEKYAKNIIKHSNDIKGIVSEFVNFARMPSPTFSLCDIVSLVSELVESRKLISYNTSYSFKSNIDKFDLVCDISQINQVMANLMLNAEEALMETEILGKITVEIKTEGELLSISVSDNGPGFPENILQSATEAYVTTKSSGTGLGLAIVDRIIQDHFGKLVIFNRNEGGATIKLIFDTRELKNKLK
jgi:two-component system nitrogen regulation sensor histidine kinase NtrY